jgi:hypothetical protein
MPRPIGPPRHCKRAGCTKALNAKQRKDKRSAFCSVSCATRHQHASGRMGGPALKRRTCACGCRKRFMPVRGYQKFATPKCVERGNAYPKKERAARRETHAQRHPHTIFLAQLRASLDAEGHAGRCLFCPAVLAVRQKYICGTGGNCEREYMKVWGRGRRYVEKCKAEGRPVEMADLEPTPEEQEAVRSIEAGRLRLVCELDSFRAKVAALARDYGLAA